MLCLWPQLHRESGPFVWSAFACGSCVPDFGSRMGRTFRTGLQTETVSRIRRSEWDSFSGRGLKWKVCPGIWLQRGIHFPVETSSGKCIPEFGLGTGRAFRIGSQPEAVFRNRRSERDAVSTRPAIRKVHPVLSVQTGTRFPLAWPLGKRGPDRGGRSGDARPSSSYSSTSLSHVGSAVCRMPAVCSFLASTPAERTSFMVKRSRG